MHVELFRVKVSYREMTAFDAEMAESVRLNPDVCVREMEQAVRDVVFHSQLANVPKESIKKMQVQVVDYDRVSSIRSLNSGQISKLICVSGIVISASKVNVKATEIAIACRNCGSKKMIGVRSGFGGAMLPRNCEHVPLGPEEPRCPIDPFVIVPDDSKYNDSQTLKLQESPEDVPTGEMPRNIAVHISDCLVNIAKPGSRVSIVGILSINETKNSNMRGGGVQAVGSRFPYLRVIGMQTDGENAASIQFTSEEEEQLKAIGRDENVYEHLYTSIIAPEIFGHDDIKKAVASQLFGGVRQHLPDGLRLRGDIHVLLLGDPSVAKSQFLKFAEKVSPIAVYTSGKGSSAAGLTASVIRDIATGEFHLEGGALVLADGGIVCIDEFDKMRPQDRVAIHEAMEQQTISIAKAGITTILNSRAGVLAAANPVFGRYDDMKSPEENIDFQSTILSRFDMIFVILDKRDAEKDFTLTKFVISMHQNAGTNEARAFNDSVFKDMPMLKKYLAYARTRCNPCLSAEAGALLVSHFVTVRENMRRQALESGSNMIPITVRQLEAIIRISESLARMQLQSVATVDHVNEAIRLFQVSTLNAAQSGAISGEGLAGSNFGELVKRAENRILRRLPINSRISYSKLVAELVALGEDEGASRRAIEVMTRHNTLSLKQQKKVVVRLN